MDRVQLQDIDTPAEGDISLAHALQLQPRASWARLGEVLEVDPVTVARRWTALSQQGVAWVSARPLDVPTRVVALVELGCSTGHSPEVAHALAADPHARTIDITSGARDLLVTLTCRDLDTLTEYLLGRLQSIRSIERVSSQVMMTAYTDLRPWQLNALTPAQIAMLSTAADRTPQPPLRPHQADWSIAAALSIDGRMPIGDIARRAQLSESTARRRLNSLLLHRQIQLRCELARAVSGWPVLVWLFARVPSELLDRTGQALACMPETRLVSSTVGPYNLMLSAWLRSVRDVQVFEASIVKDNPQVQIVDRSIVVHQYKLAGRVLDRRGFSIGVVPLPQDEQV